MRSYQRVSSYLRCQIGPNDPLLTATNWTQNLTQYSMPLARLFGAGRTDGRLNRGSTIVLRKDLVAIGHTCNEPAVTIALRAAFSEISRIRRREDRSYSGLEDGQTLYDCRWESSYFKRIMYLKFALNGEIVELFSLHEHREEDAQ